MQDQVTVLFTRRRRNPISWLIRWAMPRSRFAFALSSHAIIVAGGICYEANMIHGVRKGARAVILDGQTVVRERTYRVTDLAAGTRWGDQQLCSYRPQLPAWVPSWLQAALGTVLRILNSNYDWRGALGLGLAPGRDWAEEDVFFCYEFVAAFLRACGRDEFADLSHVGETALLAISPGF